MLQPRTFVTCTKFTCAETKSEGSSSLKPCPKPWFMDTPRLRNEGFFAIPEWFYHLQNEFQQHGREMEVVPFWRVVEAKCRCFSQDRLVLALVQSCGTWTERSLISSIPCSCAWSLISIESDLRGKKEKQAGSSDPCGVVCALWSRNWGLLLSGRGALLRWKFSIRDGAQNVQ